MKRPKVYLGNISCDYQVILPYSCGLLRAYADQDPLIKENIEWAPFLSIAVDGIQKLFERIEHPDVFGLSCYVWNFKRTLKLTRLVKEKYPDCLIRFKESSSATQSIGRPPGKKLRKIGARYGRFGRFQTVSGSKSCTALLSRYFSVKPRNFK